MILVDWGGLVLAFEEAEFEQARERGRALVPTVVATDATGEGLLDAAGMSAATGIPESWWASAAREGTVPSLRWGKYRRFLLSDAIAAASENRRR